MNDSQPYILTISGLTKTFSGVKALDTVQLNVRRGEVHALMGENGAGKSTLMKILIGLLSPDSGRDYTGWEPLNATSVQDVLKKGIAMIHQEMLNVPELTVAAEYLPGSRNDRGSVRLAG